MEHTNIIGDTAKERRIDYNLIDRINKQYELEAKKRELERKLAGKRKKKEAHVTEPIPTDNIKYIKTPDELREIKGNYSLQKGIYTIDFEIIVPSGKALILQPGVQLYFTKDTGITCEGRFEARGKDGLEVLLTAKDEEEGWKNLYLKGGAEAIVDYARFSYGKGREDKEERIYGGAILIESKEGLKSSITINNSCFENNSAEWGGAIHNKFSNLTISENNRFINNYAEYGGAIYNYKENMAIEEKNIFENNCAGYSGGAIYNYQGDVTIGEKNIFENNYADEGGAINTHKGTLYIDKSQNTFIGNTPDDISQE